MKSFECAKRSFKVCALNRVSVQKHGTLRTNGSSMSLVASSVFETRKLFQESERNIAGRTVALLGND
jgi:hypothetical protein